MTYTVKTKIAGDNRIKRDTLRGVKEDTLPFIRESVRQQCPTGGFWEVKITPED